MFNLVKQTEYYCIQSFAFGNARFTRIIIRIIMKIEKLQNLQNKFRMPVEIPEKEC